MIELFDENTAPAASRPILAAVAEANGFIPNMFRALSNAPSTLAGFAAMVDANDGGSLTPLERQIVQVTASVENRGAYCVAGHTTFTENQGLPLASIDAIRNGKPPSDRRHRALADFTRAVVRHRGHVGKSDIHAFRAAGFSDQQLLEVITGIALKTVTNYVSIVFDLPLDGEFQVHAWPESKQAAMGDATKAAAA